MTSGGAANKRKLLIAAGAVLGGGLANSLASLANVALGSPLFFDSIFTAASGAVFGPWAGIFCAVITHAFLVAFHHGDIAWSYFLPCSMATGVIVGLFAAKEHFSSARDAIFCAGLVTFANSLLGAFIAAYAYGGITTHTSDYLVTGLILFGQSILAASFWARLPLNLIDKGIAIGLAFAAFHLWGGRRGKTA